MSDEKEKTELHGRPEHLDIHIQIDRADYTVHQRVMTGQELRRVPAPPIGPDWELFEVVTGGPDRKIGDGEKVEMRDGQHFVTVERVDLHIQIDRVHYTVHQRVMTGEELRHVPTPPIGPDRDLFEVVPGGTDRKIADNDKVEIRDGKRFFTAPAQINPGRFL